LFPNIVVASTYVGTVDIKQQWKLVKVFDVTRLLHRGNRLSRA